MILLLRASPPNYAKIPLAPNDSVPRTMNYRLQRQTDDPEICAGYRLQNEVENVPCLGEGGSLIPPDSPLVETTCRTK
ncbi:hypothetical protein AVEN_129259-1 [Araneus ventricosus]|uniref:Uncharacterized protein n=1 Tax=Araneus ventricosus TaxID=182803 RepID=A0A4Y2HMV1_ARAVE|nr:hypothetical protein AVEN_129259-1 [Araneus ventricosus]